MSLQITYSSVMGFVILSDSDDPDGPELEFTREEFLEFVQACKDGELDEAMGELDKQEAP